MTVSQVITTTYTDYAKYYKYTRTVKTESNTYPSGEGISNILEWVQYELPYATPGDEQSYEYPYDSGNPPIIIDLLYVRNCAYNAYGRNYFKLRDIAYLLMGSPAQFSVEYNNTSKAISLTSGG